MGMRPNFKRPSGSIALRVGIGAVVTLVLVALISWMAATVTAPNPDQRGIVYNAGPFSETEFSNCVAPGGRDWAMPTDQSFVYPAGQRTAMFDGDGKDADFPAFGVTSKNPVQLSVSGMATYELTSDCDKLREFHERIGLKFKEEWARLTEQYIKQPLNRAITEATQGFTWEELYNDPAKKVEWEKKVSQLLPVYVNQVTGGDYFTINSVTLQKPLVSAEMQNSVDRTQQAIQDNKAQTERNATITTELTSIQALVAVLGVDGYNTYSAIKNGKVSILPLPSGVPLSIPTK